MFSYYTNLSLFQCKENPTLYSQLITNLLITNILMLITLQIFFIQNQNSLLETVLILFFRNILMYFLLRQGKIDANSHSYLRKFCSSMSEKDAKQNKWINLKQSLNNLRYSFLRGQGENHPQDHDRHFEFFQFYKLSRLF